MLKVITHYHLRNNMKLTDLPSDILQLILCQLPVKDFITMRSTCKSLAAETEDPLTERIVITQELAKMGFGLEALEALNTLSFKKLYQDSLQHYVIFHISSSATFNLDKFLTNACEQKREVLSFQKAIDFLRESRTHAPIHGRQYLVFKFCGLPADAEGKALKKNAHIVKEKLVEVAQCGSSLAQDFLDLKFQSVSEFASTYPVQPGFLSPLLQSRIDLSGRARTTLFLTADFWSQSAAAQQKTSPVSGRVSPAIRVTA
ncbi:MAG: hypothetical protein K0S08_487 [Gammaproteobacteria bacterium]|nr:hypothetical protein [Gammaproteobacteria bacterium]